MFILFTIEPVSSLLCHPSSALQKLVPGLSQSAIVSVERPAIHIMSRPVLQFLLQQHNLHCLQAAMKRALHKATCRVYAMQVSKIKRENINLLELACFVSY